MPPLQGEQSVCDEVYRAVALSAADAWTCG